MRTVERALAVINRLEAEGVFGRYAIGGAMAAIFYTEPVATFDLDIFIAFAPSRSGLISLGPLYEALSRRGYRESAECVEIEGVPVQFLPAYSPLVEEALEQAVDIRCGDVPSRVFSAEHLIAIALETGRIKDKHRVEMLRSQADIDAAKLDDILRRYDLSRKFEAWTR